MKSVLSIAPGGVCGGARKVLRASRLPLLPALVLLFPLHLAGLGLLSAVTGGARAGEVDIVDVKVLPMKLAGDNIYRFRVTVRHEDSGWDHYADAWEVLSPQGQVLGTRVLLHPHVDEQPFTRYLDIPVPAGIDSVTIRARDKVHGYSDATMSVAIPDRKLQ